jgi:hypothetical protein
MLPLPRNHLRTGSTLLQFSLDRRVIPFHTSITLLYSNKDEDEAVRLEQNELPLTLLEHLPIIHSLCGGDVVIKSKTTDTRWE